MRTRGVIFKRKAIGPSFRTGWLLMFFLASSGCDGYDSSIPDYAVHMVRNIYVCNLDSPGSYYINQNNIATESYGYGGILVVHAWDGNYYAFDRACPVEVNRKVKIRSTNQDLIFKCDSCKEEYDLSFGTGIPTKSISKEALKRYNVSINTSTNDIIVTR